MSYTFYKINELFLSCWFLDVTLDNILLTRQYINSIVNFGYWLFVCAEEKEAQKAEERAEGVSSAKRRNGVLRAHL